jgi:hypothetical protein
MSLGAIIQRLFFVTLIFSFIYYISSYKTLAKAPVKNEANYIAHMQQCLVNKPNIELSEQQRSLICNCTFTMMSINLSSKQKTTFTKMINQHQHGDLPQYFIDLTSQSHRICLFYSIMKQA